MPNFNLLNRLIMISATYLLLNRRIQRRKRRARSLWIRDWIRRRKNRGAFSLLFDELQFEDPKAFKNYVRMDVANFESLLEMVKGRIEKQDTVMRQSIPASQRLALTLRFLATGASFQDMMYNTRIPQCTISQIIPEVCEAIYDALKGYLKTPTSVEEWKAIADDFERLWNFPRCLGALDGKHVTFRPFRKYGSLFYNYKNTNSIILLALVDAKYRFIYIDIGSHGRNGDSTVYNNSKFKACLENGTLNIPAPERVNIKKSSGEVQSCLMPYTIIADDAFKLGENLMKRYPKKKLSKKMEIYNYRLSRARRVVENAFGIMANRFRILLKSIEIRDPAKVDKIVSACVALHNYLCTVNDRKYIRPGVIDVEQSDGEVINGSWRSGPISEFEFEKQGGNRTAAEYRTVRNNLADYFLYDNPLPWQEKMILPQRLRKKQ